ncbi:MAG: hypothetical protein ACR2IJ_04160 [Fluviibacter sp.]
MAKKTKSAEIEQESVPVIESTEFKPVIVQDMSSRIIRARRVHSAEELAFYEARGWVNRG